MTHAKILIVGANGKTGSRVEARLQAAGIETLGVSRSTSRAFDWTDASNWPETLEGVTAAYLTYHPDLSVPEAEGHIRTFCEMARDAGLEHVVLLSGRGEEGAARAEQVLRNSGLAWNIVQASWFAQNFSENFMLDSILAGELVVPSGTSREPFIDIDDIADVVVATLMEPGLRNRLFEVTGPRAMTFAECVVEISAAAGYPVRLVELPLEAYVQALKDQELPDYLVELLRELFTDLFDGRNAYTAEGVREALGRPATDFSEYARKTAESGAWIREERASQSLDTFRSYFEAFEATYRDDDWDRIAPYFAPDMIYNNTEGKRLEGRAAAVDYLRNDLEAMDRRFDSRAFDSEPEISGHGDQVTMRFTVRYRKAGAPDLVISGKEVATFSGGQIQQMEDVFDAATTANFESWMSEHGALLA
jgi:uncharacterized protein YbjT (DUF2867 family)